LASRGANVVLVARSRDKLTSLATQLRAEFGVTADVAVADLAEPSAANQLASELSSRGLQIDILINNAGFGLFDLLHEADGAVLAEMIRVNVTALVDLTRLYLPAMLDAIAASSSMLGQPLRFSRSPSWRSTAPPRPSCSRSPRRCGPRRAAPACV
jgi:short-subunit dehydrogenase